MLLESYSRGVHMNNKEVCMIDEMINIHENCENLQQIELARNLTANEKRASFSEDFDD